MTKPSSSSTSKRENSSGPSKFISKKHEKTPQRFMKAVKVMKSMEPQNQWDPEKEKFIIINTNEFSSIKLPKICNLIYDTPIFSRLKRIKQLGSCSYVFPSATHTRFEHSIGTASLAYEFVVASQRNLPENYKLTGNEFLDVILAALLRNLGHPAFSYLYEECFATPGLHKEMAVKLFDKILIDCPKTAVGLRQFLTERDFNLIRCLINPPRMFVNQKWNLPISRKKAYIFDIVNNLRNGLDVDKLDYTYRDGLRCGMNKYAINMNIVKRFIESAVVGINHSGEYCCLKYPESNAGEIEIIFQSKIELFKTLYYDKMILHPASNLRSLLEAQKILEAVDYREIPKLVLDVESKGINDPSLWVGNILPSLQKTLKKKSFVKEITVISKLIHAGKDFDDNPMASVLFYPRNDRNKSVLVNKTVQSVIRTYIFAPYGSKIEEVEKLFKAVQVYCKEHNLESPVSHFRSRQINYNFV
uniref:Uncharacterized protein n=1 Tax=Panagrolaimus sp. ES5 TaxID=591445 RepID=A0AC34GW32_9BILA